MDKHNLKNLVKQKKNVEIKTMLCDSDLSTLIDDSGMTLLHLAAKYNNFDLLRYLLDNELIDINVKTFSGSTPLAIATSSHGFESIKILLKSNADIFGYDNEGKSTMKILMDLLKEFSLIGKFDDTIIDLIFENYRKNNLERETKAKILVDAGCTLEFVLFIGDNVVTKTFLKNNSNIELYKLDYALQFAMYLGDDENAREFLDYMGQKNMCIGYFLLNLLQLLLSSEHWKLRSADLFLKRSMEWNIVNTEILTNYYGLMFESPNKEAIKILMNSNVDLYIRNKFGIEILVHLFNNSKVDAIKLLRNKYFQVNGKNNLGNTALHMAVKKKSEKNVKFLLDMGADPNVKNNRGMTPFYESLSFDKPLVLIANLLLQHGAKIQINNGNETIFSRISKSSKFLENTIAQLAIENSEGIPLEKYFQNEIKSRYSDLFKNCSEQISKLKKYKLSNSLTLFNLLTAKSEEIAYRLRGEDYLTKLRDYYRRDRQIHFFYYSTIKFRLLRAQKICVAKSNFAKIFSRNVDCSVTMNHLVIDKIFSFFTFYDMLQLI